MVVALAVCVSAQGKQKERSAPKTNLEIFDKSISGEVEKFFYLPDINRNYQFIFYATLNDPKLRGAKEFITGLIKKTAGRNNLNFSIAKDSGSFKSDSAYNKFAVVINEMKTSYPKFVKNKFLGEKTVQRVLKADLSISIFSSDGKVQVNDAIHVDFKDVVCLDDVEQLETEEYSFTQSAPPEVSPLEAVMFPVAIVIISAAATILFFTIRTK